MRAEPPTHPAHILCAATRARPNTASARTRNDADGLGHLGDAGGVVLLNHAARLLVLVCLVVVQGMHVAEVEAEDKAMHGWEEGTGGGACWADRHTRRQAAMRPHRRSHL